uniref:Transcription factor protein n=1 Tax=Ciona intestinalis TaxID=7719 RepID=F6XC20_CIOIN
MLQLMMDDDVTQQFIHDSLMADSMKQPNQQQQFNSFPDDYLRFNSNDINNHPIQNQQSQNMPTYTCNQNQGGYVNITNQRYHPYQQKPPVHQHYPTTNTNQQQPQQPSYPQNQILPISSYPCTSYSSYPTVSDNYQSNCNQWQSNVPNYDLNCNNSSNREVYGATPSTTYIQDQGQQVNQNFPGDFRSFQTCTATQPSYANQPYTVNARTGPVHHLTYVSPQLRNMNGDSGSSPDADFLDGDSPDIKKKGSKKRKKKGANEPQKPVSAYALFFRDTQAAIKADNPSATFGEISKIVASMWDSLSEEAKQIYKMKTETAKRDYLKQLAAYRANLVSRGGLDADDDDSQPLSILKIKMDKATSSGSGLPPPPQLQVAPNVALRGLSSSASSVPICTLGPPQTITSSVASNGIKVNPPSSDGQCHVVVHAVPQTRENSVRETTTPPPIQLRNIVPKANSPIAFLPTKGQIIKVLPPNQAATIVSLEENRNRILKMTDVIRPFVSVSVSTTSSQMTSQQSSVQPILQTLTQEQNASIGQSEQQEVGTINDMLGNTDIIDLTDASDREPILISESKESLHESQGTTQQTVRMCLRTGCGNLAIPDPQWDEEFCSSECVIKHCRDVFDGWTSARPVSASVN